MSKSNDYAEEVRNYLKKMNNEGVEKSEGLWAIAEAGAAVVDGILEPALAGAFGSAAKGLYTLITNHFEELPPNPWFVWHEHDHQTSPVTWRYMKKRGYLDAFSSISAAVSGGLSLLTLVDIGALAQHGHASKTTIAHLKALHEIAAHYRQSETIAGWIQLIITMKQCKLEVRGGQLTVSAISAIPGVSSAVAAIGGVLATAAKVGIQLKFSTVCKIAAMESHWRAYQEHVLLEGLTAGGTGPAIRILEELFSRRGVLVTLLGKHDIDAIVHEPAGWMAISDKLLLV